MCVYSLLCALLVLSVISAQCSSFSIRRQSQERHKALLLLRLLLRPDQRQLEPSYHQAQISSGRRSNAKKRCITGCPKGDRPKTTTETTENILLLRRRNDPGPRSTTHSYMY